MEKTEIFKRVEKELEDANSVHPQFNSLHEGYAVILEEVDELWDEVKKRHPDKIKVRDEAIQISAMACKLLQIL